MRVGGTVGAWTPFARPFGSTLNIGAAGDRRESGSNEPRQTQAALRGLANDVETLGDAVRRLGRLDRLSSRSVRQRAGVARGELQIDTTEVPATAATMASIEEINTVPTSYSTREPAFNGNSQAQLKLDGIYNGSNGDQTLSFEVTALSVLGLFDTEIEVRDGSGTLLETLSFDPAGGTAAMSNGLNLTKDGGGVQLGDSFTVDVFASVGTRVDENAAFNGTGDGSPEFDPGLSVTAGTFALNGVGISVAADDSLLDVIASINGSGAGVTAEFDSATERVLLSQNTPGAAPSIAFGPDSSGFLDAVKLSGAAVTPGADPSSAESVEDRLDSIASLSGVTSGSFRINGESIDVDIGNDSLADILARVGAAANVNAAVTDAGDVTIAGRGRAAFELSDDETGLLGALGIELRRYAGRRGRQSTKIANVEGVRRAVVEVRDAYNALLRGPREGVSSTNLLEVRSRLSTSVGGVFSNQLKLTGTGRLNSSLGLNLTGFDESKTRGLEIDTVKFSRALRASDGALAGLLFGTEDGAVGLVEALQESVAGAAESLGRKLDRDGSLGLRLDVTG